MSKTAFRKKILTR